jgi:hypothetical protein
MIFVSGAEWFRRFCKHLGRAHLASSKSGLRPKGVWFKWSNYDTPGKIRQLGATGYVPPVAEAGSGDYRAGSDNRRLCSGRCRVGFGFSRVSSDDRRVGFGRCRMSFGDFRVTSGGSRVTFGLCRVTFGLCRVSSGHCRIRSGDCRPKIRDYCPSKIGARARCQSVLCS